MRRLIERIISKLRGFEYHIDRDISTMQLSSYVVSRCFMAIRGFFVKTRLKQSVGLLFIGRHVKIKNARKMVLGRNSTIHDNCFINAMCRKGVTIGNLFVLGRNSTIECTGVISDLGESLQIGDNVGISQGAFISVRGKIEIGNDTIIGPNVTIISENHNIGDANTSIRLQGVSRKGIRIGSNCWFGAGVTILDGVTIGNGAVIAAGAVVTKDVCEKEIVAGIPARVIRRR